MFGQLGSFTQSLGQIKFKGRLFGAHLEAEAVKSHGKICQMHLPHKKRKGTELGDIIVAVDYVLNDPLAQKNKIVNGTASVIQTEKESYAKNGLNAAQLYLMTQWPRIDFRSRSWKFDVLSDVFAFYLFVLHPTATASGKTSIMSAAMLAKYLKVDKKAVLAKIDGKVPFSFPNLLIKDPIKLSTMPLSLSLYLLRALYLTLGSSSLKFRALLKKNFFPKMEEVEDCGVTIPELTIFQNKEAQQFENSGVPDKFLSFDDEDDGDIFSVRIKVILKIIE